jgi:glycosyltransferase involved in cell wall biosynthesis
MKVALAHHWIASYRGGEKVLEQLAKRFHSADIYTLIRVPAIHVPGLIDRRIHTSLLSKIPRIEQVYPLLLPLHPLAISRLSIPSDVDLVVSSDASLIKGIPIPTGAQHVCYCHSPPRYLWELGGDYKKSSLVTRLAFDRFAPWLRKGDFEAAQKVTYFIANSKFVADRIAKYYQRESEVIYPPVEVDAFSHAAEREDYYLVVSELVPYKRIDIAVEAFNRNGKPLVIIGDGTERARLQGIAKPNIRFVGRAKFPELKRHLETARALVFPGIEDFGITPVEAQAAGCPVLAFRAGGALETIQDKLTGLFFDEQCAEALGDCVETFERASLSAQNCRDNSLRFSTERFGQKLASFFSARFGMTWQQPTIV